MAEKSGSRKNCASRTRSNVAAAAGAAGDGRASVTALCVPARGSAATHDFLPLDDIACRADRRRLGKGLPRRSMAELKGWCSASEIHTPRALIALNRIIANHLDARSFHTMTYAVVDLRARTMTYAGGHTPLG